jgi:hypothetical protein
MALSRPIRADHRRTIAHPVMPACLIDLEALPAKMEG